MKNLTPPVAFKNNNNLFSEDGFSIIYKNYTEILNSISLENLDTYAISSVILKEFFLENIMPNPSDLENKICDKTLMLIEDTYTTYEAFKTKFIQAATSSFAYTTLLFEQRTKTLQIIPQNSPENNVIYGTYPILVLDNSEITYALSYNKNKLEYINNFMENINWNVVSKRITNIF